MRKGHPSPYRGEAAFNYKHGLEGTRFCNIYRDMRNRCVNKKYSEYHLYGGRGIQCLWTDLLSFKRDMYESYLQHVNEHGERNTSIDRINNDGNYCKENCRWATPAIQGANKRSNRLLTLNGETLTMTTWAKKYGIDVRRVHKRLLKGWTVEDAITKPITSASESGKRAARARWGKNA